MTLHDTASVGTHDLLAEKPPLSRRDIGLNGVVREVVGLHPRLRSLPVAFSVRGGVAHARGTVADHSERAELRRVVSRVRGISAVWDTVRVEGEDPFRVVEIGCGGKKEYAWSLGVDRLPCAGVDIVADLERGIPLGAREADHVFAVHVLEHIQGLVGLMNEIHRVLKPSGVLHVLVPHASCSNAVADPTHVRFFNPQTFKYFCRECPGVSPYRPGTVTCDQWNVYADLYPVQPGEAPASDDELALYFD